MLVSICSIKEKRSANPHIQLGDCPPKFHTPKGCASQEMRMTLENHIFTIKKTTALHLVVIRNILPIWVTKYLIFQETLTNQLFHLCLFIHESL